MNASIALFAALPEVGSLVLVGTALILTGAILRKVLGSHREQAAPSQRIAESYPKLESVQGSKA